MGRAPSVVSNNEGLIIEVGHEGVYNASEKLYFTNTMSGSSEPIHCFDNGTDLTAGTWYHFVVVVSSTGNTGYLNGVEMTSRVYNFGTSSDTYFFNSVNSGILSIGYGRFGFATPGQFYYFDGLIDDVRIYSRALTAAEVLVLYQQ